MLADATQIRLRADVPVGAYLSGGLDSSSLVALLKERVPADVADVLDRLRRRAASTSPRTSAPWSNTCDTTHNHVQCSLADIARRVPAHDPSHARARCCARRPRPCSCCRGWCAESNVKVVLTGEGADEVLGGYDIFKEAKVRQFWAQQPGIDVASGAAQAAVSVSRSHVGAERGLSQGILRRRPRTIPDDPCFSHLPRWATTAQCKLFWSDDFRSARRAARRSTGCGPRCPREMRGWHPFNRAEYLEAKHAAAELPAVVAGRPHADGELGGGAVPVPGPSPDRVRQPRCIRATRCTCCARSTCSRRPCAAGCPPAILQRHKQPYRAPDAAAFLGAAARRNM